MQFLALTRRRMDVFPAEHWTPELIEAESQRVRELFIAGSVRSIWRKDMPGAAIIFEVGSEDEVRALLARFHWHSEECSSLLLSRNWSPTRDSHQGNVNPVGRYFGCQTHYN